MDNTEKYDSFEKLYQAFMNRLKAIFGDLEEDEQENNYKECDCEKYCDGGKCENEIPVGAIVEKKTLFDVFTEKAKLFKDAERKEADKLEKYVDVLSDFFVNWVACALNDSDERRKFFKELYDSADTTEGIEFNFAITKEDDVAYEILKQYINTNVKWATQCAFIIRTSDFIEDKLASEFSKCPDFHVDLVMYPTKFGDIHNSNGVPFGWTRTNTAEMESPKMDANILDEERLREIKDDNVYHVILKLLFK